MTAEIFDDAHNVLERFANGHENSDAAATLRRRIERLREEGFSVTLIRVNAQGHVLPNQIPPL